MPYPTLLLPLEDDPGAEARLEQAMQLAQRFESHLVGLSCHRPAPYALPGASAVTIGMLGSDPLTTELTRAAELAGIREARFRACCANAALRAHELVCEDLEPEAAIERHAASADLVILGQADPDDAGYARRRALVDDVLQRNPRPTLVLPYANAARTLGQAVVIAWDGSHGAARAAADALPLLRTAQAVHLVRYTTPDPEAEASADASVARAAAWLARHGVKARAQTNVATIPAGDALLSTVADLGADLIVMGAWGHSRLAERVLGGVTRTIADAMTVPVLASH